MSVLWAVNMALGRILIMREDVLKTLTRFSNVVFQHRIYRYCVDFANIEEKIYLEIDGEQHYSDNRIVEHDKRRTQKLTELGWNGYRLRWSEFKKLSEDEKRSKVEYFGAVMKWLS